MEFRENVYLRCANTQPFLRNELGPFQAILGKLKSFQAIRVCNKKQAVMNKTRLRISHIKFICHFGTNRQAPLTLYSGILSLATLPWVTPWRWHRRRALPQARWGVKSLCVRKLRTRIISTSDGIDEAICNSCIGSKSTLRRWLAICWLCQAKCPKKV